MELTQAYLKSVLHYDPETGDFTWLVDKAQRRKAGSTCGYISKAGYRMICIDGRRVQAHRVACLYIQGYIPAHETDHINGNPLDNKWVNLREVTHAENMRNQRQYKNNSTGVTGVYWHDGRKKWMASIKTQYLGLYTDRFEAICARKSAEKLYGFHPNHGNLRAAQ